MIPMDEKLLEETMTALETMARKSANGEAANYARLAGDIAAARARYESTLRISPARMDGTRTPLPPEERGE